MLKWLYWHLPIGVTRYELADIKRTYHNRNSHVLEALKHIRKTCHKKEDIDGLIKWFEYWESDEGHHCK